MDNIFVTTHYRVLKLMYDNVVKTTREDYCPLGQGEIAKELNISRAIVNKVFSELRNNGYISMITRSKWKLSNKAYTFIDATSKL